MVERFNKGNILVNRKYNGLYPTETEQAVF